MGFWVLVQIALNLITFASLGILWVKLSRPMKDDPRFSRGLQLLSSKISVLEDLSDRTDTQVSQLNALLEQKLKELQSKIEEADRQIGKVEQSIAKSLEVAKIFQDKIPHQEIIERQNTIKYVKAAKLAHQGFSIQDIQKEVELSRGEIEMIAKVNRENLMFAEEALPTWVNDQLPKEKNADDFRQKKVETLFVPSVPHPTFIESSPAIEPMISPSPVAVPAKVNTSAIPMPEDVQVIERAGRKPLLVKKFEFPKVDLNGNLL